MKKSIEYKSFRGTFLGLVSFFLNIVYSLLLVPVFLSYWGGEKYGYFLAIYAFIQLMRTLDTGHQVYVGNEFSRLYYQEPTKAREILSGSIGVALLLGFVECLAFILLWFSGVLDHVIGIDLNEYPYLFAGILAMMLMWWAVGSIGGILARIILAKGLYSESVLFAILIKFLETFILIVAILENLSVSTTFTLIAFTTIIYSIIVFYWTAKQMPEYFPWWKNFNIKIGLQNFSKSVVLTVNGFLDQMNNNGLLFLITKFMAAGMIPVFTTVRTLTNTMTMMTNLVVQPLVPEMIRFHSEGKREKIWKIIEVNWLISGSLISFAFLILIPTVDPLFTLWTKGQIAFNKPLFYLMALSVVAINFGRSMTSYLIGINDLTRLSVLSAVRFVIVFGISLVFIRSLNLTAIGIGVFVSEIFCSIILPAIFVYSHLKQYQFEPIKLIMAAVPVFLLGLTILLCYYFPLAVVWICGTSSVLLLFIYIKLWQNLEEQIRTRLIGFVRSGFRKFYPVSS